MSRSGLGTNIKEVDRETAQGRGKRTQGGQGRHLSALAGLRVRRPTLSNSGGGIQAMNKVLGSGQTERAGPEFRLNASRYFHVMGEGWYIHTRDGVGGPFLQRAEAQHWLESEVLTTTTGNVQDRQSRTESDPWSHSRR